MEIVDELARYCMFFKNGEEEATVGPKTGDRPGNISMIYLDHICTTDHVYGRIAIYSILGACLYRLRLQIRHANHISIVSDNSNCYQNDVLIVVAPIISTHHMFDLDLIIHPAHQCGKGNADLHFVGGMRHIERYVNEKEPDV